jgi:hypothetical protein
MRTLLRSALLAGLVSAVSVPVSAGDLKFTMQNGRVTIIAQDVPLRQILQEWARVGNVRIVNAEKLTGPSVTLELVDVPEAQALDTLLRSAAGYMAAPRPIGVMGASLYDRIMILPTSRAPAAVASTTPAPFPQRPPQPMPTPADDDDEPVNVPVQVQAPPGMPPLILPNPGAPNPNANGQAPGVVPFANPNQPPPVMTAPRPGALPTPPPSPNGIPNPYQPSVIRPDRPGGPGGPGGPGEG